MLSAREEVDGTLCQKHLDEHYVHSYITEPESDCRVPHVYIEQIESLRLLLRFRVPMGDCTYELEVLR
jgi:hypothetical protein